MYTRNLQCDGGVMPGTNSTCGLQGAGRASTAQKAALFIWILIYDELLQAWLLEQP